MKCRTRHPELTSFVPGSFDRANQRQRLPFSVAVGMSATNWPPDLHQSVLKIDFSCFPINFLQTSWCSEKNSEPIYLNKLVKQSAPKPFEIGLLFEYQIIPKCFPDKIIPGRN